MKVFVKGCQHCQENQDDVEEVPLHPLNVPDRVWERIHLDLAGPVDVMWLVGIDAYSKGLKLNVSGPQHQLC